MSAVALLEVILMGVFFWILILLEKIFQIDIIRNMSRIFIAGLALIALVGIYKYYSARRIACLMERFETKPFLERKIWGYIAVLLVLIPWISFPIVFTKHHT